MRRRREDSDVHHTSQNQLDSFCFPELEEGSSFLGLLPFGGQIHEMRYLAAKQLGWKTIKATLTTDGEWKN
jgi:hypothetical protein